MTGCSGRRSPEMKRTWCSEVGRLLKWTAWRARGCSRRRCNACMGSCCALCWSLISGSCCKVSRCWPKLGPLAVLWPVAESEEGSSWIVLRRHCARVYLSLWCFAFDRLGKCCLKGRMLIYSASSESQTWNFGLSYFIMRFCSWNSSLKIVFKHSHSMVILLTFLLIKSNNSSC